MFCKAFGGQVRPEDRDASPSWHAVTPDVTLGAVIRSWRHKGLAELFRTGRSRRVRQDQKGRIVRCLDALTSAADVIELDIPGFGLHKLKGKPQRCAIAVNGPWRITFEWKDGGAHEVDLEQYH